MLHSKEKIKLPNRTATFVARSQQMSRFLDSTTIDLQKDDENLALQHDIKNELKQITRNTSPSITSLNATRPPLATRPVVSATSVSSSSDSHRQQDMEDIDIELEQRKKQTDKEKDKLLKHWHKNH